MHNIAEEILLNTDDILYNFGIKNVEETSMISYAPNCNRNNPVFLILTGTLLALSVPMDSAALSLSIDNATEQITESSFDSFLIDYSTKIDQKFSNYFENDLVKSLTPKLNSKLDITRKIISFQSLKNDWDGYGAIPLEVESAANAIELIELLGWASYTRIDELYPNPNGTISFIWTNSLNERISIEVGNKTMSYYVDLKSKDTEYHDNKIIDDIEAEKITNYIQKLF